MGTVLNGMELAKIIEYFFGTKPLNYKMYNNFVNCDRGQSVLKNDTEENLSANNIRSQRPLNLSVTITQLPIHRVCEIE